MTEFIFFEYLRRRIRNYQYKRIVRPDFSNEQRFTMIYNKNLWGSIESKSGIGSTLENTTDVRSLLPTILNEFKVKNVFDAPCGDFNWMRDVDLAGVEYLGGDIVKSLVDSLRLDFSTPGVDFTYHDLTKDRFLKFDLVINRDCLFHFSYSDIYAFLGLFLDSGSSYLLTTSHENNNSFTNKDIFSGDFRLLDLFSSPFDFPKDFLFKIAEEYGLDFPARGIFLWDKDQVEVGYRNLGLHLSGL